MHCEADQPIMVPDELSGGAMLTTPKQAHRQATDEGWIHGGSDSGLKIALSSHRGSGRNSVRIEMDLRASPRRRRRHGPGVGRPPGS